jgi:hypothetical protein
MVEMRNTYRTEVGKHKGRNLVESCGLDERIILK